MIMISIALLILVCRTVNSQEYLLTKKPPVFASPSPSPPATRLGPYIPPTAAVPAPVQKISQPAPAPVAATAQPPFATPVPAPSPLTPQALAGGQQSVPSGYRPTGGPIPGTQPPPPPGGYGQPNPGPQPYGQPGFGQVTRPPNPGYGLPPPVQPGGYGQVPQPQPYPPPGQPGGGYGTGTGQTSIGNPSGQPGGGYGSRPPIGQPGNGYGPGQSPGQTVGGYPGGQPGGGYGTGVGQGYVPGPAPGPGPAPVPAPGPAPYPALTPTPSGYGNSQVPIQPQPGYGSGTAQTAGNQISYFHITYQITGPGQNPSGQPDLGYGSVSTVPSVPVPGTQPYQPATPQPSPPGPLITQPPGGYSPGPTGTPGGGYPGQSIGYATATGPPGGGYGPPQATSVPGVEYGQIVPTSPPGGGYPSQPGGYGPAESDGSLSGGYGSGQVSGPDGGYGSGSIGGYVPAPPSIGQPGGDGYGIGQPSIYDGANGQISGGYGPAPPGQPDGGFPPGYGSVLPPGQSGSGYDGAIGQPNVQPGGSLYGGGGNTGGCGGTSTGGCGTGVGVGGYPSGQPGNSGGCGGVGGCGVGTGVVGGYPSGQPGNGYIGQPSVPTGGGDGASVQTSGGYGLGQPDGGSIFGPPSVQQPGVWGSIGYGGSPLGQPGIPTSLGSYVGNTNGQGQGQDYGTGTGSVPGFYGPAVQQPSGYPQVPSYGALTGVGQVPCGNPGNPGPCGGGPITGAGYGTGTGTGGCAGCTGTGGNPYGVGVNPGGCGGTGGCSGGCSGGSGGYGTVYRDDSSGASGSRGNDPCFRKICNTAVVNAQPYERRADTSLDACKNLCRPTSSSKIFQCRGFVYDNPNRICDLFAHAGDQLPSKLVRLVNRDYYEPTNSPNCANSGSKFSAADAGNCPSSETARYIAVSGYQYSAGGRGTQDSGNTVQSCQDSCNTGKTSDGKSIVCKSFDFNHVSNQCTFYDSSPAIGANGAGLQQSSNTIHVDRICIDSTAAQNCKGPFERNVQSLIIGHAETVVDATSFTDCMQQCLETQSGSNPCNSGLFYYNDKTQNCILNRVTKTDHPDLYKRQFADEIVDYFEPNCKGTAVSASSATSRFSSVRGILSNGSKRKSAKSERTPNLGQWGEWSNCDEPRKDHEGLRVRYQECGRSNIRNCPQETAPCPTKLKISGKQKPIETDDVQLVAVAEVPDRSSSPSEDDSLDSDCPPENCCPIFGSCRIGLKRSANGLDVTLCPDPCKSRAK